MGATNLSAISIRVLVLIVVTSLVPTVGASDLDRTIEEARSEAQAAAQQAQADAEREAQQAREEAAERAEETQEEAKTHLTVAVGAASGALAEVVKAVEGAAAAAKEILVQAGLMPGPEAPEESASGFRSESSDYAIVRPNIAVPLVWITASVSGLLVLLVAARKILGLGAIPLLSRIAHSDIYNNDARRTIHELVVGEPGQCLNELVSRTGYSRNAVSYHLFVLEKEEEIVSVKDGKYRRYFTRNGKYVNGAKNVVAALRNETTLKLAKVVMERPGAIQRDLCVELGATPSATCWHAKRLLDLGVIRKERVANTVKYYPGEAMAKYDLSDMGLPRFMGLPAAAPAPTFPPASA